MEPQFYFRSTGDREFYPLKGGIAIIGKTLQVNGERFDINDLSNLQWSPLSPPRIRKIIIRLLGADAIIAMIIAAADRSLIAILAAVGYLIFSAVVIRLAIYRWPPPLLLFGDYRGRPVKLFQSSDHAEFSAVRRALIRAVELCRAAPTDGLPPRGERGHPRRSDYHRGR